MQTQISSLLVLSFVLVFLQGSEGCGFITHMEAANRAALFFNRTFEGYDIRKLIHKHPDAFQTGVVYPDAFYSPICLQGEFGHFSKITHGLDYIKAALDYFTKTYGTGMGENGEKLLVFILGNIAHDVQDKVWHGYGIDQGFVDTIAQVNFNGDFAAAHGVVDWAGDSVALYELSLINLHLGTSQWFIPLDDLYNIYKSFMCRRPGGIACDAISGLRKAILYCPRLVMGRSMLHKMLIHRWYVSFGMKAPMAISPRFTDYFMGGINDMAQWTMQRMETGVLYLENKSSCYNTSDSALYWMCADQPHLTPPPESWMNPNDQNSKGVSLYDEHQSKASVMARLFKETDKLAEEYGSDESMTEVIETKSGGVLFRSKGALRKSMNKLLMKDLFEHGENQRANDGSEEQFAAENKDHFKFFVKRPYSLIGQAMVSADVNKDGLDDLIVGVPGFSEDNRFEEGRVYVVKAQEEKGLPSEDTDIEKVAQVIEAPFQGPGRFGYQIVAIDYNGDGNLDLAISAPIQSVNVVSKPYSGSVYIYFGSESGQFSSAPDVEINCNMRYCNFGTTLSSGDVNGDGRQDLIVGSPYASKSFESMKQNGMVSVFFGGSAHTKITSFHHADLVTWGLSQYSWFGHAAITTKACSLLIGAPGTKTASSHQHSCHPDLQMSGQVYCYNFNEKKMMPFAHGTKEFEFFGATLAEGYPLGKKNSPVLAIGAPNSDNVGKVVKFLPYLIRQSGTIYLYNSATGGIINELVGDRLYGAFGRMIKFVDADQDGFDDLLVGSPTRSTDPTNVLYGEGIGELYLYYGSSQFPNKALSRQCQGRYSPCPDQQADGTFSTKMRRAQLGSNAVLLRSTNRTQLVVAQQRTDDYARQSGKLVLFNNCLSLSAL